MGLWLGDEAPIVAWHVHGVAEGSGHLDQRAGIGAAKFEHDDGMLAVFAEAGGHGGASRARTDDDEVSVHEAGSQKPLTVRGMERGAPLPPNLPHQGGGVSPLPWLLAVS